MSVQYVHSFTTPPSSALLVKDSLEAADYLDVLSHLVEQYEAEAHPISPASDAEMLRDPIRCVQGYAG